MASPWCRLWADMPNDPKWRTIAKVSKQSIGNVIAVYIHMMTCASTQANATERGRTIGWRDEDVATALDVETEQVTAILAAMEGRVLEGDYLTGWDRRQSIREDEGAAERAKAFREREKAKKLAEKNALITQPNATERNRTTEVEVEVEVDKKVQEQRTLVPSDAGDLLPSAIVKPDCPHQSIIALYHERLPQCPAIRDWTPARATQLRARWNESAERQNLDYWARLFEYIGTCDFLVGRSAKPWFADLEWITKSQNFTKIREGKYENRT